MREKQSHAAAATGTRLQSLRVLPSLLTLRSLILSSLILSSMNDGSWVVRECPPASFPYLCGRRLAFPIEDS